MNKFRVKLLVGGVILLAAVGYLAYAGFKAGQVYYIPVDTFMADKQYHSAKVRLMGTVGERVAIDTGTMRADFDLVGQSAKIAVAYKGPLPDLFKAGADVVVEGRLQEGGNFKADKVLTKCASKYEGMGKTTTQAAKPVPMK